MKTLHISLDNNAIVTKTLTSILSDITTFDNVQFESSAITYDARDKSEILLRASKLRALECYAKYKSPSVGVCRGLFIDFGGWESYIKQENWETSKRLYEGKYIKEKTVIAYTEDGDPDNIQYFDGVVEGEVKRGEFVLKSFNMSFQDAAEGCKDTEELIYSAYTKLVTYLNKDITQYEGHITLEPIRNSEREKFDALCEALSVKKLFIELDKGKHRIQPMITFYVCGSLQSAKAKAELLAKEFVLQKFKVVRIKLESCITVKFAPKTPEDVILQTSLGRYFEYHIGVEFDNNPKLLDILKEIVSPHNAHVSTNSSKQIPDKLFRFVTMRVFDGTVSEAQERFDTLLAVIENYCHTYRIVSEEREYVVYDSNRQLDSGWA